MSNNENSVGYGRPPKASRFRKGTSGNPTGRPKRPPSIASDVASVLQGPTEYRGRRMTVQRALILKVVEEAIEGDSKDRLAALKFLAHIGGDSTHDDPRADEDARFIAKLQREESPAPGAASDG